MWHKPHHWWFVTVVLVVAGLVFWYYSRPLSLEQVNRDLGDDPDLIFEFGAASADPPVCDASGTGDDDLAEQNAAAVAAGWVTRRCERGKIELRFTAAGLRLPAKSPLDLMPHDESGVLTTTFRLPVARFDRTGSPRFQRREWSWRHVVVPGRWVPNREGQLLARAGWHPILAPALREESFELRIRGWHLIPRTLGIDLSDL